MMMMYHINNNPNKKHTFRIQLNDTGKFFQLIDNSGGVIAECFSWRMLKKYAENEKLTLTFLYGK
jgi:hypothetical protein